MLYMSSNSSSSGAYSLTVTFAVGTDIDMATVQVQNRVSVAQSSLPAPVVVQGVTVQKQSSNIVMFLTMKSDNKDYDGLYLSNYAKLNLVDQLTRVPGVGAVNVMGAGDYSMRIWLDPAAMRIRNLSPADVYQAIQTQNVEVSAGNVGQPIGNENKNAYQYSLTVKGRLTSPEEFGNIILRTESGGRILRLRDVAHIDLGSASYSVVSQLDGKPTAAIAIYQQPGSNSLDVSTGVKAKMQELSQNFPAGVQYNVTLDTTDVIHASIDEVMVTFFETTLLVVLVIFLSAELAGCHHSLYHNSRFTDRYVSNHVIIRFLYQYFNVVRADIGGCHRGGRRHCGRGKLHTSVGYGTVYRPASRNRGNGRDYRPHCGSSAGVACRIYPYHACQRDFGTIVQAVCLDHCCQYRAKRHQLTDADARTLRIDAPAHQTLEIPSV